MSRLQRIFKKCFNHSDSRVIAESIGSGSGSTLTWVTLDDVVFEETESGAVANLTDAQRQKIINAYNVRILGNPGVHYGGIVLLDNSIYTDVKEQYVFL